VAASAKAAMRMRRSAGVPPAKRRSCILTGIGD
jgi:hypothetical protein